MMISGFTFVHNGIEGGYPFMEAVRAVQPFVDEVVAVDAESTDGTREALARLPFVRVVDGPWGREAGETLARLHAMNADWIRRLDEGDLLARVTELFQVKGLVRHPPTAEEAATLRGGVPLVQERITTLNEAVDMLRFLFVAEAEFVVDPASAARGFGPDAGAVLDAAAQALYALADWSAETVAEALKQSLIGG